MIKQFIFSLAAVIIFSSCANKFSLVKRKYNKGYHIGISSNKSAKKSENLNANRAQNKTAIRGSAIDAVKEEVVYAAPQVKSTEALNEKSLPASPAKQNFQKEKHFFASSDNKQDLMVSKTFKPLKENSASFTQKQKGGDSGVMKLLMIILCFFPIINLIPVYVHDNGVTLNFWITLLLCLTLIGSIIFSLLVVLDIVDLS